MSSKPTKSRKYLTKRPYTSLLHAAGSADKYQTGYEIIQKMRGSGSQDVYRMLKELAPSKYVEDKLLLILDDFSTNVDNGVYKRELIQKLNKLFGLTWEIGSNKNDTRDNNERIQFKIEEGSKYIAIQHDSSNVIVINLNEVEQYGYAYLDIFNEGKKLIGINGKLIIKRNGKTGKLGLYTTKYCQTRVRYLDIGLNDKAEKSKSELQNQVQSGSTGYNEDELGSSSKVLEIENNRDNWVYRLNFRGLLVFLAGESKVEDLTKRNREIRDVISREWIVEKAPFLDEWEYFERVGFDVIGTLGDIGGEFSSQAINDNAATDYLFIRTVQRYYDVLSAYFYWFDKSTYVAKNRKYLEEYRKHDVYDKLHKYRLKTLNLIRTALSKEIAEIRKLERFHRKETTNNAVINEASHLVEDDSNAIISLDKLANKHRISNSSILTIFASTLNNNYYKDSHIIIDTYLIPYSIIAPLFLIEGDMRFEDIFSLLYTIPLSLHHKLIRRLGFEILPKKWNGHRKVTIVKRKEPSMDISYNQVGINY